MISARSAYFIIGLAAFAVSFWATPVPAASVEQVAQSGGGTLPALPPALARQLQQLAPAPVPDNAPRPFEAQPNDQPAADSDDAQTNPGRGRQLNRRDREAIAGRTLRASNGGPDAIERDLSARAGTPLRLFGFDAFEQMSDAPATTGVIRDSYVIGFDDEIIVDLRGQIGRTLRGYVGRDGTLLLPELPPVSAVGRSFGEFRREMEDTVKRALGNVDTFVSLGTVHQISVLMSGSVDRPGIHRLDAFATIIQAIDGQLGADASYRNLLIRHDGKDRRIDLYELLLADHMSQDISVADGDQIFVPVLKSAVAIAGEVTRPAIYEIPEGGITAAELVRLASGYVRPSGNRLIRLSLDASGRDQATEITAPETTRLRPTDVLLVQRSENVQIGIVQLEGNVRVPGPRSTSAVHSVKELLRPDLLNVDPYLPFVVVLTIDPVTLSRNFVAVDYSSIVGGRDDYPLKTGDTVIVLSKNDIRYLNSADVQAVLQGRTPPGANNGIVRMPVATVLAQENRSASPTGAAGGGTVAPTGPESGRTATGASTFTSSCPALQALAAVANIDRSGRFAVAIRGSSGSDVVIENALPCPAEFAKYPELLSFVLEHAISVDGEVREPGVYPVTGNANLAELVEVAGGITRAADLKSVEVSHFTIDQTAGQSDIRRDQLALEPSDFINVKLNPGDAVRFNPVFNNRDDGPVLLSGEFRRPGLYDIKRGEHLSSLYARAGGMTEASYPYGAILTRARARAAEQEARQRTMRDLQVALGNATASSGPDTVRGNEASTEAQQALVTLAATPALGRVVFEADPAVLELHPELDIVLEPGDRIYMPKRATSVTIAGDVLNPSTQEFRDGLVTRDYIDRSGGFLATADEGRVFVILPNGQSEAAAVSFWNFSKVSVPPGSMIVVPRELSGDTLALVRDLSTVLSQAALTAAALVVIGR